MQKEKLRLEKEAHDRAVRESMEKAERQKHEKEDHEAK